MGVKGGPNPDFLINNQNIKFFFDASNQMAYVSTTSNTNLIKRGSYTDWTIDSSNAVFAGSGASRYLDTQSYQQFKNSLTAAGTFNAATQFSWSVILYGGSTTNSNMFLRTDDSTGNFIINANGTYEHQHAGTAYTSSGLGLTSTTWKHLILTRSGTACTLYQNNISVYAYTLGNNNSITDYNFRHNTYPGSTVDLAYLVYWHDYVLNSDERLKEYERVKRRFSLP